MQEAEAPFPLTSCQSYLPAGGDLVLPFEGWTTAHTKIWKWKNLRGFIKKSLSIPAGVSAALALALEDEVLLRPLLAILGSHPFVDNNKNPLPVLPLTLTHILEAPGPPDSPAGNVTSQNNSDSRIHSCLALKHSL